ncbi:MAG: L-aspartate oxidase [Dissulfuribacterales bacterium]
MKFETDFLIVGSGISGLSLAIKLSELGRVTILTKKKVNDTATNLAQGGVCCVTGEDDDFGLHEYDTIKAGDGLCHEDIVRLIVRQAPERMAELESYGLQFDRDKKGRINLGKEGGHARRRIWHVGDYTGRAIQEVLTRRARECGNITLLEDHTAVDLIVMNANGCFQGHCEAMPDETVITTQQELRPAESSHEKRRVVGLYALNGATGEIDAFLSRCTVLSTGGCGKVYLYTTNPDVATGDGIAMAYRAGARVANLEFVQFHPTCLYHPQRKNFLISEALRGEGARLINCEGEAFMKKYAPHEMELANRDVIARAIDAELKKSGRDYVYLDITHKKPDFLKKRFPQIYAVCLKLGIDITREPIPVVPAAHYMCGGVVTDSYGQTDIPGLFAIGETACTGFHGANRLASNSLLENLVMAHQAFVRIHSIWRHLKSLSFTAPPEWETGKAVDMQEGVLVSHNWDTIRRLMWDYVGIVRSAKRLSLATQRIEPILKEIHQHYWDYLLTSDFIELRNLAQVASLVIRAANARLESRGGHYMMDYPQKDDWNWRRDTLLLRNHTT